MTARRTSNSKPKEVSTRTLLLKPGCWEGYRAYLARHPYNYDGDDDWDFERGRHLAAAAMCIGNAPRWPRRTSISRELLALADFIVTTS